MEFQCPKCNKVFYPHAFIGMRHPSQAKCPICKVRGHITERGKKTRESRFYAVNQANAESTNVNSPKFIARQGERR